MGRRFALVVFVLLIVSLRSTVARACSCMSSSVESARDSAAAVFEGRVLSIRPEGSDSDGSLQVTLAVARTWKGLEHTQRVTVTTSGASVSCRYPFEKQERYLVYAYGANAQSLQVSLCSRTKPLADAAEDLLVLGTGQRPTQRGAALTADSGQHALAADAGRPESEPDQHAHPAANTYEADASPSAPPQDSATAPRATPPAPKHSASCTPEPASRPTQAMPWLVALTALTLRRRSRPRR